MAKTRVKKELESSALTERLQKMKVAVLTTTAGLKVKDMTELRTALRAEGVEYVVAKKTLVRRALSAAKLEQVDLSPVDSSFSLTFGYDDEVTPAKLLAQFAKTHEALKFLGGILDGAFVDAERMKQLAKLPSRDQLRGQVVGTIAAPLSGFVSVLAGNLRGLVRVLDAVRQKQSAS